MTQDGHTRPQLPPDPPAADDLPTERYGGHRQHGEPGEPGEPGAAGLDEQRADNPTAPLSGRVSAAAPRSSATCPDADPHHKTVQKTVRLTKSPRSADTVRLSEKQPSPRDTVQLAPSGRDATSTDAKSIDAADSAQDTLPVRAQGPVLRFGPGVTGPPASPTGAGAAAVWHGTPPEGVAVPKRRGRGRPRLRRYALALTVLLAVTGFLLWQRFVPALAVEDVTVRTSRNGPACNGTADVVGVVTTNGRAGTLQYRWLRSDGSSSGVLREEIRHGQHEVRLHLLWTFRGRGSHRAQAELKITAPTERSATTRFTYRCL